MAKISKRLKMMKLVHFGSAYGFWFSLGVSAAHFIVLKEQYLGEKLLVMMPSQSVKIATTTFMGEAVTQTVFTIQKCGSNLVDLIAIMLARSNGA